MKKPGLKNINDFFVKDITSSHIEVKKSHVNLFVSRKGHEKLDFLLLIIEALEINALFLMLEIAQDNSIKSLVPNQVELWKLRSYNPLRKASRIGNLNNNQIEALILLVSVMAERLYPKTRQLLSSKESETLNTDRWSHVISNFNLLIRQRMNINRSYIKYILHEKNNLRFIKQLIVTLSLCGGEAGANRLRASLYDDL